MPRQLKVEITWNCKVCSEMAMGVYEGPDNADAIVDWAQAGHDRLSPDCPYKFKSVQVESMDSPPKGKKGRDRSE